MFIKFCGFTRLIDALYAASLGVDALGFVFYASSKRYIAPPRATMICAAVRATYFNTALSAPLMVGLFVNHTAQDIQAIDAAVNLDVLQFHGDETPEFCEMIAKSLGKPYIKVVRMHAGEHFSQANLQVLQTTCPSAYAFLLDHQSVDYGGSGQSFDWQAVDASIWQQQLTIKKSVANMAAHTPLVILAGGIDVNNTEQLKQLGINAVDMSSGIEQKNSQQSQKGVKSQALMLQMQQQLKA